MSVLMLTKSDDNDCVDRVAAAVEARGESTIRFDTDRFPTEVRLVMERGTDVPRTFLLDGDARHDLADVSAVWYRRIYAGARLPDSMDPQVRKASLGETRVTVQGLVGLLDGFQLDRAVAVQRARNKPVQLEVARELGLATPRTLLTNDADAVRAFAKRCPAGIVTKMMTSFAVYEDEVEKVVFTTPLDDDAIADLEGLELCPMTFQERIEKALELRVTIVGHRVFAASIDSKASPGAEEDWRREGVALLDRWRPYELLKEVAQRLVSLLDRFGLNYGAIDVIVTPSGEHVFIEVNPIGEFFWLELHPGFPISDAVAEVLVDPGARRVS